MRLATVALFALCLAAGLPAAAFDLTGHWEGSWSCSAFDAGFKTKEFNKESTLAITSIGDGTFRAILDNDLDYRGIEIPDAAKPEKGEIGFVSCGANDNLVLFPFVEFGRFKISTSEERGTGSLSGTTTWSRDATHIATCKYKFKRVDVTDPGLTYACP
jgi:hypothetical protein